MDGNRNGAGRVAFYEKVSDLKCTIFNFYIEKLLRSEVACSFSAAFGDER